MQFNLWNNWIEFIKYTPNYYHFCLNFDINLPKNGKLPREFPENGRHRPGQSHVMPPFLRPGKEIFFVQKIPIPILLIINKPPFRLLLLSASVFIAVVFVVCATTAVVFTTDWWSKDLINLNKLVAIWSNSDLCLRFFFFKITIFLSYLIKF